MNANPAAAMVVVPPTRNDIAREVVAGLCAPQKSIAPKYFYDQAGSALFDLICDQPEYYLTRTEQRIMEENISEIADLIGPRASIIEFGSGSSAKIRKLLDHLHQPAAYVPVDISSDYLLEVARELSIDYPAVEIRPLAADFTRPFALPEFETPPRKNVAFFPGSTIGNFHDRDARKLLSVMHTEAKPGGALLIGVDLIKDPEILHAAYNDGRGVTAKFNLNVLRHLNRVLGANFVPEHFRHQAIYDEARHRIEMRLVSTRRQTVTLDNSRIEFERDEYIITEYSHKFAADSFISVAADVGFRSERMWVDEDKLFSVHYLTVPAVTSRS